MSKTPSWLKYVIAFAFPASTPWAAGADLKISIAAGIGGLAGLLFNDKTKARIKNP